MLAALTLGSAVSAQWSSDPAANLSVADAASDQAQPKVVATADGGVWISWFDGIASGYDVRAQKLDVGGNEVFPHGGLLVKDRGFSSTQDYGLDVDANGNALLTFRDDSVGGTQITAAKMTPAGALAWGAGGIQLTNTANFVAAPSIAGTSDGGAVVAWTENSDVKLQKLDAAGAALWGPGVTLVPPVGSYSVSDLHDAGNEAILSFVHQTGGFGSPRRIRAQKFDGSGALLWGAAHVDVFDTGSLQFGNFPDFAPDASGGAVFSWYTSSPTLQCFVQRILANGSEAFPHNGVPVATNPLRERVDPCASYDPSTGETFVFWEELASAQALSGFYGQKLDASGARQWTDDGIAFVPISATQISQASALAGGGEAAAFWCASPSFGTDTLHGVQVQGDGTTAAGPFDVASTPSGKSRLAVAASTAGFSVLAWTDDRVDSGDVLAQNVNADGSLGAGGGTVYCTAKTSSAGCVTAIATSLAGDPVSGANDYAVTASLVQDGKNGLLFGSLGGAAAIPFNGGVLCMNPPLKRGPVMSSGGINPTQCNGTFATTVNDGAILPAGLDAGPGNSANYQYWYRDPQNGAGQLGTALSNAVELDFL